MRLKGNLCWSNHPLTKRQLPSLRYAAIIPPILLNSKGGPKFKTANDRKTRSDAKGDFPMKDKPLANVRVAILATNDFEQSEMTEPRQALKEAGAQNDFDRPEIRKTSGDEARHKSGLLRR